MLREGCTVHGDLRARDLDEPFVGLTTRGDCGSNLRGASYATSEVRITLDGVDSWDRGFDDSGRQVWGAVAGPYRFDRLSDDPPSPTR